MALAQRLREFLARVPGSSVSCELVSSFQNGPLTSAQGQISLCGRGLVYSDESNDRVAWPTPDPRFTYFDVRFDAIVAQQMDLLLGRTAELADRAITYAANQADRAIQYTTNQADRAITHTTNEAQGLLQQIAGNTVNIADNVLRGNAYEVTSAADRHIQGTANAVAAEVTSSALNIIHQEREHLTRDFQRANEELDQQRQQFDEFVRREQLRLQNVEQQLTTESEAQRTKENEIQKLARESEAEKKTFEQQRKELERLQQQLAAKKREFETERKEFNEECQAKANILDEAHDQLRKNRKRAELANFRAHINRSVESLPSATQPPLRSNATNPKISAFSSRAGCPSSNPLLPRQTQSASHQQRQGPTVPPSPHHHHDSDELSDDQNSHLLNEIDDMNGEATDVENESSCIRATNKWKKRETGVEFSERATLPFLNASLSTAEFEAFWRRRLRPPTSAPDWSVDLIDDTIAMLLSSHRLCQKTAGSGSALEYHHARHFEMIVHHALKTRLRIHGSASQTHYVKLRNELAAARNKNRFKGRYQKSYITVESIFTPIVLSIDKQKTYRRPSKFPHSRSNSQRRNERSRSNSQTRRRPPGKRPTPPPTDE